MEKTNESPINKIFDIFLFTFLFIALGIYIYQIFTQPILNNLKVILINAFLFIGLFSWIFIFYKRWR